jgi:hypothetical protein
MRGMVCQSRCVLDSRFFSDLRLFRTAVTLGPTPIQRIYLFIYFQEYTHITMKSLHCLIHTLVEVVGKAVILIIVVRKYLQNT